MANQKEETKKTRKFTTNEKYLNQIFHLLKKCENVTLADKKSVLKDTELRLIGEILSAKVDGKRLISTQLAKALGVTRSAISQTVNRLEKRGVVKRVADDVDRKIAYIEVTEEVLSQYQKEIKRCTNFVGNAVKTYGEEKFNTMYQMVTEFCDLIEAEKEDSKRK